MLKSSKKYRFHSQKKTLPLNPGMNSIQIQRRYDQQNQSNTWCEFVQKKKRIDQKSFIQQILKDHNGFQKLQKRPISGNKVMQTRQDYQKLRLNQSIMFLSNKVQSQYAQINGLAQQLSFEKELKQQFYTELQLQKQKTKKLKILVQGTNKKLFQTNKKFSACQSISKRQTQKNDDNQYKINKIRQMLKKKQQTICKLQQSLASRSSDLKKKELQQKQLQALRVNYIKAKHRQEQMREQSDKIKKKLQSCNRTIQELKKQVTQKDQRILCLEDKIIRVSQKLRLIQQFHKQQVQQNQKIQKQYQRIVKDMNEQIFELKNKNLLLNVIKGGQKNNQNLTSDKKQSQENIHTQQNNIYIKQMQRILRDIKDKKCRLKVQNQMCLLFEQVQNGWKNVLLGMVQSG